MQNPDLAQDIERLKRRGLRFQPNLTSKVTPDKATYKLPLTALQFGGSGGVDVMAEWLGQVLGES